MEIVVIGCVAVAVGIASRNLRYPAILLASALTLVAAGVAWTFGITRGWTILTIPAALQTGYFAGLLLSSAGALRRCRRGCRTVCDTHPG